MNWSIDQLMHEIVWIPAFRGQFYGKKEQKGGLVGAHRTKKNNFTGFNIQLIQGGSGQDPRSSRYEMGLREVRNKARSDYNMEKKFGKYGSPRGKIRQGLGQNGRMMKPGMQGRGQNAQNHSKYVRN